MSMGCRPDITVGPEALQNIVGDYISDAIDKLEEHCPWVAEELRNGVNIYFTDLTQSQHPDCVGMDGCASIGGSNPWIQIDQTWDISNYSPQDVADLADLLMHEAGHAVGGCEDRVVNGVNTHQNYFDDGCPPPPQIAARMALRVTVGGGGCGPEEHSAHQGAAS